MPDETVIDGEIVALDESAGLLFLAHGLDRPAKSSSGGVTPRITSAAKMLSTRKYSARFSPVRFPLYPRSASDNLQRHS
jgi:hypothetical protein